MKKFVEPDWQVPVGISAFCSTREGGVSVRPYDTFNLAQHVGDDIKSVDSNRGILMRELALPVEPCWLNQTHSIQVETIVDAEQYNLDVDAAITRQAKVVAVVMTADCLPILLCNRAGNEVAAIHAGWRGLADGIVQATLAEMLSPAKELLAWIGPAISQNRFEVGDEVHQIFIRQNSAAKQRFVANRPGHWLCDLPGLAADVLKRSGLNAVKQSGLCSYEGESRFYSYRREKITGRMASLIWINPTA